MFPAPPVEVNTNSLALCVIVIPLPADKVIAPDTPDIDVTPALVPPPEELNVKTLPLCPMLVFVPLTNVIAPLLLVPLPLNVMEDTPADTETGVYDTSIVIVLFPDVPKDNVLVGELKTSGPDRVFRVVTPADTLTGVYDTSKKILLPKALIDMVLLKEDRFTTPD
jgi:hypothetical protein